MVDIVAPKAAVMRLRHSIDEPVLPQARPPLAAIASSSAAADSRRCPADARSATGDCGEPGHVALSVRVAENELVARGSFFQRDFVRKQRDVGLPLHLIAHEDVIVFQTPGRRSSAARRSRTC
jgi:hypothetical protein